MIPLIAPSWNPFSPNSFSAASSSLFRDFEAAETLSLLGAGRISVMFSVPTVYRALCEAPEFAETGFSAVRSWACGGAPLSERVVMRFAERGALILDGNAPKVLMVNGNRQARNTTTGRINILYFERYTVDLGGIGDAVQRTARDQNELFVDELLNPTEQITQPRNFLKYKAEGHSRLVTPLLGIALPLIGLVIILKGEFSRRGQSKRLILAILLVGLVQAAVLGSKYAAAKEIGLLPLMYGSAIAPILISLIILSRQKLRRPKAPASPVEESPA